MKWLAIAAVAAMGALLSGCATAIKGETQTVSIASPPVEGARCVFFTRERYYGDVLTPGRITIPRDRHDVSVVCTKLGFKDGSTTVPADFNFVTLGNLPIGVLFGVIGLTTGVVVDVTSGANNSYQHEIEVPMDPLPAAAEPELAYTLADQAS